MGRAVIKAGRKDPKEKQTSCGLLFLFVLFGSKRIVSLPEPVRLNLMSLSSFHFRTAPDKLTTLCFCAIINLGKAVDAMNEQVKVI